MKYNILLKILRTAVYAKRFLWWLGPKTSLFFARYLSYLWKPVAYLNYKIGYVFKKTKQESLIGRFTKRDSLQIFLFLFLFFVLIPQTKLQTKKDEYLNGQDTVAFKILNIEESFSLEEIVAYDIDLPEPESPEWKEGVLTNEPGNVFAGENISHDQELAGVVAGSSALSKPVISPGAVVGSGTRDEAIEYTVEEGDSLGTISYKFGISLATLLWENNLTSRSIIRPGNTLDIPPTTGIMHTVKKGDTILKIANSYNGNASEIIKFNRLKSDGSNIQIGERLMIPDGVKVNTYVAPASSPSVPASSYTGSVPAGSVQKPSTSGFVWPSAAKIITQYYSWSHHGLDVAGPWQSANYAAKDGVVEVASYGWNSGYGNYVIINHGNGVKTLYGHHSKILVSVGDRVKAGQTIGLMGNSGKVYGRTGIHLHFEIQINGSRVNPLGYIR